MIKDYAHLIHVVTELRKLMPNIEVLEEDNRVILDTGLKSDGHGILKIAGKKRKTPGKKDSKNGS